MAVIMDKGLQEKLEQIKKREWWPVTTLAKVLERHFMYVYRRINKGDFSFIEDGTFKKVLSKSVVEFYENRVNPISIYIIEENAFKKGFNAGLRVCETAQELDIALDELKERLADYCNGEYDDSCNKRDA